MKIAVVGAGVTGLVAADRLGRSHQVLLFEQHAQAGGHAHTITVDTPRGPLALDTGFLVYNERTYPLFTALLRELGVETIASDMSFSVTCERCGLQYRGTPRGLFAQPTRLVDPGHWRFLVGIVRFQRWARATGRSLVDGEMSLAQAVTAARASHSLSSHYLLPMTSAIWSSSAGDAQAFPWTAWLSFFENHGLLRLTGRPQWRSIAGGSRVYVDALLERLGARVQLATPVRSLARTPSGVRISTAAGAVLVDAVVLAVHADEALRLLSDPTDDESAALAGVEYSSNQIVLHTDARHLPARHAARAAWNVRMTDCTLESSPPQLTYYLNALQRLRTATPYCVTVNAASAIAPELVLARRTFAHPIYGRRGAEVRQRIRTLNGARRTWFCGAYLGYGFHEDGVRAALDVVEAVERRNAA